MAKKRVFSSFRAWLLIPLFFLGCGGSGGDSGGSSGSSPTALVSYTGSRDQATIDSNNGPVIAKSVYTGTTTASTPGMGVNAQLEQREPAPPAYFPFIFAIQNSVGEMDLNTPARNSGGTILKDLFTTVNGPCGGNANFAPVMDSGGSFSGTMTFNHYCDEGTVLTGTISMSGTSTSGHVNRITMQTDGLTAQRGGQSLMITGTFEFDFSVYPASITLDVVIQDTADNKVVWIQDCTLRASIYSGYVDITMSGKFYYPDYGYVTFSTPTAFRVPRDGGGPTQGVLVITGGNNTQARLTVLTSNSYKVEVDANHDGTYEWDHTYNWS